jgi:hypothetical protein
MEQAKQRHIDQWTPIKVMENRPLQVPPLKLFASGTTQVAALGSFFGTNSAKKENSGS